MKIYHWLFLTSFLFALDGSWLGPALLILAIVAYETRRKE